LGAWPNLLIKPILAYIVDRAKPYEGLTLTVKTDPCYGMKVKQGKSVTCLFFKVPLRITLSMESSRRDLSIDMVVGRRNLSDTEFVRHGSSTNSCVVRLGFVGQLPSRTTSVSDNFLHLLKTGVGQNRGKYLL